jgi:hypothetical protein
MYDFSCTNVPMKSLFYTPILSYEINVHLFIIQMFTRNLENEQPSICTEPQQINLDWLKREGKRKRKKININSN